MKKGGVLWVKIYTRFSQLANEAKGVRHHAMFYQ